MRLISGDSKLTTQVARALQHAKTGGGEATRSGGGKSSYSRPVGMLDGSIGDAFTADA